MQKLSQTEELARTLAARARRHALTPEQISRAMDEQDYDVAQLDELYTALEARGVHLTEEEADLPALDETQIGRLEHERSAEGVALDDPVKAYLKEIGRVPLKQTCGWWCRWQSAMQGGACRFWISFRKAISA